MKGKPGLPGPRGSLGAKGNQVSVMTWGFVVGGITLKVVS